MTHTPTTSDPRLVDYIGHCKHYSIGTRRVWWHDNVNNSDWQVKVSVDIDLGQLIVQSGPCWDYEDGTPDGMWGEECSKGLVTHHVSGYDRKGLIEFAGWVQDHFVGDQGILAAACHLIAAQEAQRDRESDACNGDLFVG